MMDTSILFVQFVVDAMDINAAPDGPIGVDLIKSACAIAGFDVPMEIFDLLGTESKFAAVCSSLDPTEVAEFLSDEKMCTAGRLHELVGQLLRSGSVAKFRLCISQCSTLLVDRGMNEALVEELSALADPEI